MLKELLAESENHKLVLLVNGMYAIIAFGKTRQFHHAVYAEAKQKFIDLVPMSETIMWFTDK